ncbi:MAG TPA: hypothetical protein VGD59_14875, partial [Acidisarcina sp.]
VPALESITPRLWRSPRWIASSRDKGSTASVAFSSTELPWKVLAAGGWIASGLEEPPLLRGALPELPPEPPVAEPV